MAGSKESPHKGGASPPPFDSSLVRIQPRILLAPLLASSDKFPDTG